MHLSIPIITHPRPLADAHASYIEKADSENTIITTIVVYEVYRKIKNEKGERKH